MTSESITDDRSPGFKEPVDILVFMFFGLCLGVITMQLLMRFDKSENVPYTVVLFILGFILSTLPRSDNNHADAFVESVQAWIHIDAELILFVFLPPLIFGEAMNLNCHHAKAAFMPGLALAGPGVIIGAGLMGVFAKVVLPASYGWSWLLAMTFGSVLSATDTVAVLSVLKSTGAGTKLTMLIVGESLLNDGIALVLFELFNQMMEGEEFSVGRIIGFIISSTVGSALFGILCGLLVVRWLRSASNPLKEADITAQSAMTICCAYLIFFIAQDTLKISGALACTFAGGMVSWLGPPIIISHESMHNVWGFVEWMGNTLIFLLAGLIIGRRTTDSNIITSVDWLYAFVFYLLLMVTRFVLVVILFPFLSSKTHIVTWQEGIFISWGGLRGALSMTLALIVENSGKGRVNEDGAFRLFFFTGIIATLTLLVNATLSKYVLFSLKLIEDNVIEKELVVGQIRKRLCKKMNKVLDTLAAELYEDEITNIRSSLTLLQKNHAQSDLNLARLSLMQQQDGIPSVHQPTRSSLLRNTAVGSLGNESAVNKSDNNSKDRVDSTATSGTALYEDEGDDFADLDTESLFQQGGDRSSSRSNSTLGLRLSRVSSTTTSSLFRGSRKDSTLQTTRPSFLDVESNNNNNNHIGSTMHNNNTINNSNNNRNSDSNRNNSVDKNSSKDDQIFLGSPNSSFEETTNGQNNQISSKNKYYNSSITSNNIDSSNSKNSGKISDYDDNKPRQRRGIRDKSISRSRSARQSRRSRAQGFSTNSSRFLGETQFGLVASQMHSVANLLSMGGRRGASPVIVIDLVVYIRCVFLEIVRVRYWHLIQTGRLSRLSHSSQYLLYSIDVGIDEVRHSEGLQDWPVLESYVRGCPFFISLLTKIDNCLCRTDLTESLSEYICKLEANEEKRIVYLLTSFIEAHEHAQSKIHQFIGSDGDDDDETDLKVSGNNADYNTRASVLLREQTPEELLVIEESKEAVSRAKALLTCIPEDTVRSIRAKQSARTVLYKEETMVKSMVAEGLLTNRHAEEFLEEISEDRQEIEIERANTYDEDYANCRELRNRKFEAVLSTGNIKKVNSDSMLDSSMIKPLLRTSTLNSDKF